MLPRQEIARQTIVRTKGSIPVIITVAHGGGAKGALFFSELPVINPAREKNEGTVFLVWRMLSLLPDSCRPYTLHQGVERPRLTMEMVLDFYDEIILVMEEVFEKFGRCYLIDIHSFAHQPVFGTYDVIFGTNNRRTIARDFDSQFAAALQKAAFLQGVCNGLKIYVPEDAPREGEKFGATKNMTLVKWVKDREPDVSAIQVEIYKDWFISLEIKVIIAKIFSDAIRMIM